MLSLVYGLMKKRKIIFKKRILIKYYFIKSFCSSLYMLFICQASILIRVASLPVILEKSLYFLFARINSGCYYLFVINKDFNNTFVYKYM